MGGDTSADTSTEQQQSTDGVKINIRCSNGSKFSVQISLDSTVGSFKDVVAQNCDISADQQRLIYKGRILKDDQTLQSYGINPIFCDFYIFSFIIKFDLFLGVVQRLCFLIYIFM
jgi:ubiquilin